MTLLTLIHERVSHTDLFLSVISHLFGHMLHVRRDLFTKTVSVGFCPILHLSVHQIFHLSHMKKDFPLQLFYAHMENVHKNRGVETYPVFVLMILSHAKMLQHSLC